MHVHGIANTVKKIFGTHIQCHQSMRCTNLLQYMYHVTMDSCGLFSFFERSSNLIKIGHFVMHVSSSVPLLSSWIRFRRFNSKFCAKYCRCIFASRFHANLPSHLRLTFHFLLPKLCSGTPLLVFCRVPLLLKQKEHSQYQKLWSRKQWKEKQKKN